MKPQQGRLRLRYATQGFAPSPAAHRSLEPPSQNRDETMPMKNPPHPGGLVLRECIEPLGLTITDAAAALGVTARCQNW